MTRVIRGAAVALAAMGLTAGTAQAASPDAVIGEVYGGGGNGGATLKQDFVELANRSGAAVELGGFSVQYLPASASANSTWQATPLDGSLPANGRFLVAEARGAGGTVDLPTSDAAGTIALSATGGTVALVEGTTALTCKTAAACTADPRVRDLVGYGPSTVVREGTPTAATDATTSAARTGTPPADTDDNSADLQVGAPTPTNAAGETTGGGTDPAQDATVEQIQGPGFSSPLDGERVTNVAGVVTAVRATGSSRGFYLQQVTGRDPDDRTSPGLFVFTGSTTPAVQVGQAVSLTGTVDEYAPTATSQTTTELTGATVDSAVAGALPDPEALPPVPADRFATAAGDTTTDDSLEPAAAALDYWEAREGTLVTTPGADVVGPTSDFDETEVVMDGVTASRTARGGIAVSAGDFNPERIKVEGLPVANVPASDVGDRFGAVTGVVDHDFDNPTIYATAPVERTDGGLERETTRAPAAGELAVATFNVENLSPADDQAKFDALADQIVGNLAAPDLLALEEVQDNTGPTDDGTVAANQTLDRLVAAIAAAGGPAYEWRQIDPTDDTDGGQPGGNIRQAFLFRTDRGLAFTDRPGGDATTPVAVTAGPALSASPGRIDPANAAWNASRKPLVGEFTYGGAPLFVVANHFNSKGGDQPLFGRNQPPARSSETQRRAQATAVRDFVDDVRDADPDARIVVLGDLNDFEFSDAVGILTAGGALTDLPATLPLAQRYTYVFEGNSQVLDHILLSPGLAGRPYDYDVVHTNAEFADQISDHDPQVVRLAAGAAAATPAFGELPASVDPGAGSVPVVVSCPATVTTAYCIGTVRATTAPGDRAAGSRFYVLRRGVTRTLTVGLRRALVRDADSLTLTLRSRGTVVDTRTLPVGTIG